MTDSERFELIGWLAVEFGRAVDAIQHGRFLGSGVEAEMREGVDADGWVTHTPTGKMTLTVSWQRKDDA